MLVVGSGRKTRCSNGTHKTKGQLERRAQELDQGHQKEQAQNSEVFWKFEWLQEGSDGLSLGAQAIILALQSTV